MKTTTLYDLEAAEMAALQSPDGFTLEFPDGRFIILRAAQNGEKGVRNLSGKVPDTFPDDQAQKPRGKYLCKHGCGESFDNHFSASAHSRYKHPKRQKAAGMDGKGTRRTARMLRAMTGDNSGTFPCAPCNKIFTSKKWLENHQVKRHGLKINSGIAVRRGMYSDPSMGHNAHGERRGLDNL